MDLLEIYIPVGAEVKTISLCSLPNSVLRRMGVVPPDSDGSNKLPDSPKVICICPTVIRRKGQKLKSHTRKGVKENMMSLLGREARPTSGSYRMSFVSSNHRAYEVLMETMPQNTTCSHPSTPLPQGTSLQSCQDAIIIYNKQIYLSVRNPKRSKGHRESVPSPSGLAPKSQKEVTFQSYNSSLISKGFVVKGNVSQASFRLPVGPLS